MAWTAPKTYASGDVLTAANMNATAGRDNELILKTSIDDLGNLSPDIETSSVTSNQNNLAITVTTGTLVFTGASAIDITGIVAPATAGKLLSIVNRGSGTHTLKDDVTSTAANRFDLGADVALATDDSIVLVYENSRWRAWCKPPSAAAAPITAYAVTLANVANTTSETSSMSFTVPADAMADGDVIWLRGTALVKNNSGSASTLLAKVHWGSVSANVNTGGTLADDGTEAKWMVGVMLMRAGNDIWVIDIVPTFFNNVGTINMPNMSGHTALAVENVVVLSSCTFDSGQTVALKITQGVASAACYFNAQGARVNLFSV